MGGTGSGGCNRKSAKRKRVEGNAGKRKPKRKSRPRSRAVSSDPLGLPPSHLKAAQKKVWDELSAIVPIGAVEASDRWAFELLVCLMSKFRRGEAKAGEVSQISSQLARFGMTPADRGRVNASLPPPMKNDPYAKFNLPAQPRSTQ